MEFGHLKLNTELTEPQEDTIKLVASSLSLKEIASKRGILSVSVQDMLGRLYRKTGARDRFELAIFAVKKGLVTI